MKKIVSFLLTITLVFCNGFTILAEEIPTPPADQISSNPYFAFVEKDFSQIFRDGENEIWISFVRTSITYKGSSSIGIYIRTEANEECVSIEATVLVQRWHNNMWETYSTLGYYDYFVSEQVVRDTLSVESGYYYRLSVLHFIMNWEMSDSASSVTDGLFIV